MPKRPNRSILRDATRNGQRHIEAHTMLHDHT